MRTKEMEELALFRFSIIAPILNGLEAFPSKEEFFRLAANRTHVFKGKDYTFAPGTIKDWYHKYQNNGLNALMPKERSDIGASRTLSDEAKERIFELKREFRFITGTAIYEELKANGLITKTSPVSLSTVLRFINANDLAKPVATVELKAFSFPNANDSWQADTSFLFNISINGKSEKTCVIAFLDDASRKIVGADIYLSDSALNVQKTLKKAIARYGVPHRLHLDNGSSYKNHQLSLICARLGIHQIYCQVRKASSKGKIERFFNTLKTQWLAVLDKSKIKSLEAFQSLLDEFTYDYNARIHSTLKQSPNERFNFDYKLIKYKPIEELDILFLNEISRRVNNDSTIQIEKTIYEVPSIYIGERITIKYNPEEMGIVFVSDKGELHPVRKLNREENVRVKRKPIYYDMLGGLKK